MVNCAKTPCIGVCSTGIGDSVCRGCKRFSHEVVAWNGYSEIERVSILHRLDALLRQVLEARIEIFDEPLLRRQLELQQIRFHPQQTPYAWFFEVLKVGSGQINRIEDFGVRLHREYAEMSLREFKQLVDEDFYILSCVHFERYFEVV